MFASVRLENWFQVENGVGDAHQDLQETDDRVGPEDDNEDDDVSEISGLSDVSITGAGRWHPMKGSLRSSILSVRSATLSKLLGRFVSFGAQ